MNMNVRPSFFLLSLSLFLPQMYDPYWSVAPIIVAAWWTYLQPVLSMRAILIVCVISVWGVRLTVNFMRRWRGVGHEDWRYVDLREEWHDLYWLVRQRERKEEENKVIEREQRENKVIETERTP